MEDFSNIVDNFKPLFPDNIQVKKAYLNFPDDDFAPEEKISSVKWQNTKDFKWIIVLCDMSGVTCQGTKSVTHKVHHKV